METTSEIWIAACAHQLHRRWRTADAEQLEEVARELWHAKDLRDLPPTVAAELWLAPVVSGLPSMQSDLMSRMASANQGGRT